MFKWFINCQNARDCKKRYYELCKEFHPDNGGNEETMKTINAEFMDAIKYFSEHSAESTGEHSADRTCEHSTDRGFKREHSADIPQNLIKILSRLSTFRDIEIEICGTWIWLTGITYPIKDILKELGFRWSSSKKRWYYTENEKCYYKKGKSMKQIRSMYGSTIYEERRECLN